MTAAALSSLHCDEYGSAAPGLPVVMSHALGLDGRMWRDLALALAPRHPVLCFDHRGQGRSRRLDTSQTAYGIEDLVDDAAAVVQAWDRGPVVFVGLSMGGLVGQGLGARHGHLLRGLLLANTVACYPEAARQGFDQRARRALEEGMDGLADAVLERFLSPACRAARPDLAESVRAQVASADPLGYAAACLAIRAVDWRAQLPQIRVPTRVVAGAQDLGATVAMAQEIADAVPGAQLSVLDAAHLSALEQPQAFARELQALLDSLKT